MAVKSILDGIAEKVLAPFAGAEFVAGKYAREFFPNRLFRNVFRAIPIRPAGLRHPGTLAAGHEDKPFREIRLDFNTVLTKAGSN